MRVANTLSTLAISIAALAVSAPAQAALIIDIQEVGPDVVATTSGSIDLHGLTPGEFGLSPEVSSIFPSGPSFSSAEPGILLRRFSNTSGPTQFGTGNFTVASSSSGDAVYVSSAPNHTVLHVSADYLSGEALSATMTFAGYTLASLGVTPGTYVFTVPSDTITFTIGSAATAAVPEPATWATMLLGMFALGGVMRAGRRPRARAHA